jgi:hypothetical protein
MQKALLILVVVLGMGFLGAVASSQEDVDLLDNSWFEPARRPPVAFAHDEHNEAAELENCAECHHVYEDGVKSEYDSSEDQSCGDCHELDDIGNQPGLMRAFHMNCKGCHVKRRQGPVVCGGCHLE